MEQVVPYLPGGNNAYKRPRVALEMTILAKMPPPATPSFSRRLRLDSLARNKAGIMVVCRCE
jgi:hypothetical protein